MPPRGTCNRSAITRDAIAVRCRAAQWSKAHILTQEQKAAPTGADDHRQGDDLTFQCTARPPVKNKF